MIRVDQFIATIHQAVLSANELFHHEQRKMLETYFEPTAKGPDKGVLKPRTVAMEFPEQTADGVVMRHIHIPLITLVPVTTAQVAEVKFKSNLEIQTDNDHILMGFATARTPAGESAPASASIEISITPQPHAEGLRKLIEGYEKILRSQLPN